MELMERLPKSLAQPRPAKLRQTLCEFGGSRGPNNTTKVLSFSSTCFPRRLAGSIHRALGDTHAIPSWKQR